MHFSTTLLAFAAAATAAVVPTGPEYNLKTCLKPNQPHKAKYNDLYLYGYHTGAGLNDPGLSHNRSIAAKGYLKHVKGENAIVGNNQLFDLGSEFPYDLVMVPYEVAYSSWQPVRINAGSGGNGEDVSNFFINATGLQWTTTPNKPGSPDDMFGGWIVCDWWHG